MFFALKWFGVSVVCLLCAGVMCRGAEPKITTDFNYAASRPAGLALVREADFIVNVERIRTLQEFRPVFGSRKHFVEMAEFLRSDPVGQEIWRSELQRSGIVERVNTWRMPRYSGGYTSYWAHYRMPLMRGALVWFFTGNRAAGEFVRTYMLHAMSLPDWYWFSHFAYRADFAQRRMAFLSNGEVARMTVYVLTFAGDLFSAEERAMIEGKLRKNAVEAIHSFFTHSDLFNNFHAVLGSGMFLAARTLGDRESEAYAKNKLKHFIEKGFHTDGSYGEGYHYALYALEHLRWAFEAMNSKERQEMFQTSPLAGSSRWLAYFLAEKSLYAKQRSPYKTLHGDANYFGSEQPLVFYWLADYWNDPVAGELGRRTGRGNSWWIDGIFSLLSGSGKVPVAAMPELGSPALFDSGDNFIYHKNDTVLTTFNLYRVNSENGTFHHHKRPENGSFTLTFNNFPLILSAGNTNQYGSDLHRNYALRTAAANTVTVGSADQRSPKLQRNTILGHFSDAKIQAIALDCSSGWEQAKSMVRSVVYLSEYNAFIISDAVVLKKQDRLSSHLHLNHVRHDSSLEELGPGRYRYSHAFAALSIGCYAGSDSVVVSRKGYTVSELFAPGALAAQRGEERRGNIFALSFGPEKAVSQARLTWVLIPHLPGAEKPDFAFAPDRVSVGNYQIAYEDRTIKINSPDGRIHTVSLQIPGAENVRIEDEKR